MLKLISRTVFFIGILSIAIKAQEGWNGIIPLITTKEEVQKKLGKADKYGRFETKEGRVSINYINTRCKKVMRCDCLAPIGSVMSIRITLYNDLPLEALKLNSKTYKKTRDSHLSDVTTYANEKTGVIYEIQDGKVTHINYYESKKVCQKIKQDFLRKSNPK